MLACSVLALFGQPVLQNDDCGHTIELSAPLAGSVAIEPLSGLEAAKAFVLTVNLDAEAPVQSIGEFAGTAGHSGFAAVHVKRQANDSSFGLPVRQQVVYELPIRHAVSCFKVRQRACGGGKALADGNADKAGAKIEAQHQTTRRVMHWA
jgi:hypothetical protein